MDARLYPIEDMLLRQLEGKFVTAATDDAKKALVFAAAKSLRATVSPEDLNAIIADINDISPIAEYMTDETIEDVMINNTKNIFIYSAKEGSRKLDKRFETMESLNRFVAKLKLYSTNKSANGNIMDVHMYNGSRANIIKSPLGPDITIRNFRGQPYSILDLVNVQTLDYKMAARLWLYTDGFRIRPANMLIGGVPAAGKTSLLNALFSFFRPDQRIVTIEETYELNTSTMENAVRLETSEDMPMVELVRNALRMRPDMIIVGEVRGPEANDMLAAMNVGKIGMGTIHASSTRDIVSRLEHAPMRVPRDIIPAIDALLVISVVHEAGMRVRKIIQASEISGIETQVLLSDIYKYDYKAHQGSPILPSVTYRDTISKLLGVPPTDILAEEAVRARILEQLNKAGKRDIASISEAVRDYYDNPENFLLRIGLPQLAPVIKA